MLKQIHRLSLMTALFALAGLVLAAPSVSWAEQIDNELGVYWHNGLRMDSADKRFRFKIGGRIMNDWAFYDGNSNIEAVAGNIEDGTEFRRARLYVAGELYNRVIFKAQYDFAGGDADFKDVYVGMKNLPYLGTLRVGHVFEPMGLEENTSSKYMTFMERALPFAPALTPSRNTGILAGNAVLDQRMTWALGVFRDTDGFGDSKGDEYNFTGRLTGLPLYHGADKLVHVGFSYRLTDPTDGEVRFRQRPESHQAPTFVDTRQGGNDIVSDEVNTIAFEAATVMGPFSAQAEYIHAFVDSPSSGDPEFYGYYAFVSYWLTGEHRVYSRKAGTFSRVTPLSDFLEDGGCGAWELALRFSMLDLSDKGIDGGELADVTVGLNWHLNANTRMMLNYVHSELDKRGLSSDEEIDLGQVRFQIDF